MNRTDLHKKLYTQTVALVFLLAACNSVFSSELPALIKQNTVKIEITAPSEGELTIASYALEVARYLQLEHNVEDPDIAKYYAFDLGEPAFAGEQAKIIAFGDNENIRILSA